MTAGTAHVRFHWYKKGTGHLPFKRPDLVDQCNRILAKHYLEALVHTIRGSHTYHIASRVFVSGRVAVASGVLAPRGQKLHPR